MLWQRPQPAERPSVKAILCRHFGPPDDLEVADIPDPVAGPGEVGLAAVELGRTMGARVIACASTDDKLAFARAHGADEVVNYEREDLRDALKRLGGEHGIDVVFDPVGGAYSEPALRSLAWEGRHLVVGFAAGEIPKLPLNLVLLKGCAVLGVFWGAWVRSCKDEYKAALAEL